MKIQSLLDQVKYNADGLVTALVQDFESGDMLMVAYMNAETLRMTLESKTMTYWSRSRQEVWIKGQTSGNTQEVEEVRIDCDGDALLFKVHQKGAACHTGFYSCFYRKLTDEGLEEVGDRQFDPKDVYGK